VELIKDKTMVGAHLIPDLESGDLVLILGAGDINRIAAPLLQSLKERP
jgi:UDP-N-acetylmuramate-alanine ligase